MEALKEIEGKLNEISFFISSISMEANALGNVCYTAGDVTDDENLIGVGLLLKDVNKKLGDFPDMMDDVKYDIKNALKTATTEPAETEAE
mgnify:CR=1 FL=1